MVNLKKLVYTAEECGSFLYSAVHGLTRGNADCDGKSFYLPKGFDWKEDFSTPIPLYMNFINISRSDKQQIAKNLPKILRENCEKVRTYTSILTPFFELGRKTFVIGEDELSIKPLNQIIAPSQIPIDSDARSFSSDVIRQELDLEQYQVVAKANHQRFFRKFCPWYFEQNPSYAHLTSTEKQKIIPYVDTIKNENPANSKELEELTK